MPDTVRILAIDPGSNCGYAIMDVIRPMPAGLKADPKMAGVWDLHQKRFEGAGMRYVRLRKFMAEAKPDFVVYEQVNFRHKSLCAELVYGGIISNISSFCEENKIGYAAVDTGLVKRKATGKAGGKGTDKTYMSAQANVFFNINPPLDESDKTTNKDHNIADALWLMQIALDEYASVVKKREV